MDKESVDISENSAPLQSTCDRGVPKNCAMGDRAGNEDNAGLRIPNQAVRTGKNR